MDFIELFNDLRVDARSSPFVPLIRESNKRKRDDLASTQKSLNDSMKSMSQLSISQVAAAKKLKHAPTETTSTNQEITSEVDAHDFNLYKPSKYLRMPRRLLLHSLHLQLNCPLKKKQEQRFILARLKTIDQQFCLEQLRSLYQTYFDFGVQHQLWLVSFVTICSHCTLFTAIFQG